jgi:Flp pilus assembly protein TadD
LDKKEEEFSAYSEALKVNSQDTNLLLLLAAYHEKNNEFDNAIEQYEKILFINPHNKEAKNNFASILLDHYGETKDVDKAVQLSESFKQLKQPYFLDTYGWAQLKLGNKELALSIFEEVIILAPEVPVFRYHLAVAYYGMSDTMTAALELRQALRNGKGKAFPEKVLIEKLLAQIKNK